MEGCFVAGADPELMLTNTEGNLISAIGIVPGTKKRPRKVQNGAIQHDNVMAEFNVDPAANFDEFEHNLRNVLRALSKVVRPNRLVVRASADFPETELQHAKARVFGCDPDFDSWSLGMNQIDPAASLSGFRSAGGHLHIGKKAGLEAMLDDPYGKIEVVKMLDIFVGIPSIFVDPDPTAAARRSLYGKAGAHRPKPYGVEYRALGNFWVRSPMLAKLVYTLADKAVALTRDGQSKDIIERIGEANVQEIINTSDKKKAKVAFRKLMRFMPANIMDQINALDTSVDLYEAWGM